MLSFFMGNWLLIGIHIVSLRKFQYFVNQLIVIRLSFSLWQRPIAESLIDIQQHIVPQLRIWPPTFIRFCKIWDEREDFGIKLRQGVLVEVSFDVICVEEDQQQKLLILVLLE